MNRTRRGDSRHPEDHFFFAIFVIRYRIVARESEARSDVRITCKNRNFNSFTIFHSYSVLRRLFLIHFSYLISALGLIFSYGCTYVEAARISNTIVRKLYIRRISIARVSSTPSSPRNRPVGGGRLSRFNSIVLRESKFLPEYPRNNPDEIDDVHCLEIRPRINLHKPRG